MQHPKERLRKQKRNSWGVQHNLANNYPFAPNCVKGEGSTFYDIDGSKYIDFIGAGGPSILGNNDPMFTML